MPKNYFGRRHPISKLFRPLNLLWWSLCKPFPWGTLFFHENLYITEILQGLANLILPKAWEGGAPVNPSSRSPFDWRDRGTKFPRDGYTSGLHQNKWRYANPPMLEILEEPAFGINDHARVPVVAPLDYFKVFLSWQLVEHRLHIRQAARRILGADGDMSRN